MGEEERENEVNERTYYFALTEAIALFAPNDGLFDLICILI